MKREYLLSGSPFFLYPLRKFIRSIEVEILPQCGFSVVLLLASSLPALHDEEKERLQVLIRQTEGAPIAIERGSCSILCTTTLSLNGNTACIMKRGH